MNKPLVDFKAINKLYEPIDWKHEDKHISLSVKFEEYSDPFNIELLDWHGKIDCKVGHFGYNFYFRTPKGIKYLKYQSIQSLKRAITRTAKGHGLTVTNYYYSIN